MQKRIQKWKRFLAIFLMGAMLLTNDYGLTSVFAEETGSNTGNTRAGGAATNIELNADVLINNDDGVVDAGEKFQYQLQYTVPNLESGSGQYTGAMLMFYLPEYVHLVTDKDGKTVSVSKSTSTDKVTLTLPTGKNLEKDDNRIGALKNTPIIWRSLA